MAKNELLKNEINLTPEIVSQVFKHLLRNPLKEIITEVIEEIEESKKQKSAPVLYTVNQARKILKRSHEYVKKRIESGEIKTTADGKITETELNRLLDDE